MGSGEVLENMLVLLLQASALLTGPAVLPRAIAPSRAAVKMIWHVFPREGASGILKTDYYVDRGMTQTLGRYDMVEYEGQKMHVAPDQCVVHAAEDGSCIYVYAQGQLPTGWRTGPHEPWTWMNPGESIALTNGHKVSLDYNDPEAAVYKFERSGWAEEYGSYASTGQQQGYGGATQLPPGWTSGIDQQSGQTFYYNQNTGQSQWEPPM